MQSNNYHSAKARNGRLGGLAKAKNNAARVEKARLENTEKVLLLALKQPAMKQADIAENTGVAQSFVSGVLTLKVKILRLEILAKEKKSTDASIEKFILHYLYNGKRPRPKPTAL
jgi:predicted XRE-type DNA-binding protein